MGRLQSGSARLSLADAGRDVLWRRWDDAFCLYQRTSGETHVFNETTAEILRCLRDGPLSLPDLIGRVAAAFGVDPSEFSAADFRFLVERLEHLGIAEWLDDPGTDP